MKTNVIMKRTMGDFCVEQRTCDAKFNATALLQQWNKVSGQKKQMIHYTENNSTQEFINALQVDQYLNRENPPYLQSPNNQCFAKQRNSVLIQVRGKKGGTWMHPLLFIDFAMWLNPRFKVQVLKFVYDELIKVRSVAADNYSRLSCSAAVLSGVDFSMIAKGLNWIVFGTHHRDIRNCASQEQLQELDGLQQKLAFSIDMGYIKNFPELITSMRQIYSKKHIQF